MLIEKHGVSSFKIFMFYGSHGLHGASDSQRQFLMIGEDQRYDYAHFEFIMRGIQAAREQMPERAHQISLSLHCETAEIMTAYTRIVEKDTSLKGLAAYSASRRSTRRAWRCSSPATSPTKPRCPTSTCCT
jgi:allantoinase